MVSHIHFVTPERTWKFELAECPRQGETVILDAKTYRVKKVTHNVGMRYVEVLLVSADG